MKLETPHAEAIISMLEEAQDIGMTYTVWGEDVNGWALNTSNFSFFDTYGAAQAHWEKQNEPDEESTIFDEGIYRFLSVERLLEQMKLANGLIKEVDMGRDELREFLKSTGYHQSAIDGLIADHDQGTYPLTSLFHRKLYGADMLNVHLNFETDGFTLRFKDGHAGLFHVPIVHEVIEGFDTCEFEARLQAVDWAPDHRFLMIEFPEDAENNKLATETIPAIYEDLKRLYRHSPEGRILAEQLLIRNISWHFADDRNDPLQPLTGEKYYKAMELTDVRSPDKMYEQLALRPIPDIDIAVHVERFIDRQLKHYSFNHLKTKDMNLNNLENLNDELTKLGFGKKVKEDMRQQMEKGVSDFTLHDRVTGNKGQVDLTLHFKQSGQSDNYYLNKFDVQLLNGKPLGEDEKYMVMNPAVQKDGKPLVKSFDHANEAIDFFKAQKGDATLASGKDWASKTELAKMEKDNVNYVHKEFSRTYRNPGISQTFFVERGKGFTAEQAVNLIQGRAVFRDDLIKLNGDPFKAWNKLDMDSQKDRYHNFGMLQYHVPTYGFILENVLDKFNIKELDNEKQREKLIEAVQNGNRALVTVSKDGQENKLFMEVSPRYSQLNFFREDGKPEKREQFLKEPAKESKMEVQKDKAQAKTQAQGMAV